MHFPTSLRFTHIKEELVEFERERQEEVGEDETLLGSSEIIESVIGKYKRLQNDQVKGGFTGMILGLVMMDIEPFQKVQRQLRPSCGRRMSENQPHAFVDFADSLLYQAKRNGRNAVEYGFFRFSHEFERHGFQ